MQKIETGEAKQAAADAKRLNKISSKSVQKRENFIKFSSKSVQKR